MKITTRDMCLCAMFAALTAVGAFLKIPVPVCPFTLQTLFTTMAGLLLGSKRGAFSILIYIIIGLIGVPVFTQGGGFGYVMVPTFGYIIGFCVGAFLTGFITERIKKLTFLKLFGACLAGLAVIYLLGMSYYYVLSNYISGGTPISMMNLFYYCFLLVIPGDILLSVIAALLAKRLLPVISRNSYDN